MPPPDLAHRSVQLRPQFVETGSIRRRRGAHHEVDGGNAREDALSQYLP